MNVTPAHPATKAFATNAVVASAIEVPGGVGATDMGHATDPTLISTQEVAEELDPGSRLVTEAEVRAATGAEKAGWHAAAQREYQESFMDMNAVARATPADIARAGGRHKALPMKVVWTQKTRQEEVPCSRVRQLRGA